ncbi:hypothetical protein AA313_de0204215 [Arthrobotrys entomopaga]|nr:hypothetical protein AA313_de0204215 [Arthrobotrys entomopaga]
MSAPNQERSDDRVSILDGMDFPALDAAVAAAAVDLEPLPPQQRQEQQQEARHLNPNAAEYIPAGPSGGSSSRSINNTSNSSSGNHSHIPLCNRTLVLINPRDIKDIIQFFLLLLIIISSHIILRTILQIIYKHLIFKVHLSFKVHQLPALGFFSHPPPQNHPRPNYHPSSNLSTPWRNQLQHSPTSGTLIPAQSQQAQPTPLAHPKPSRSRPTILLSSPERAVEISDLGSRKRASLKKPVYSPELSVAGPATNPRIAAAAAEETSDTESQPSSPSPLQLDPTSGNVAHSQQMSSQQPPASTSRRASKRSRDPGMNTQGESSSTQMQTEREQYALAQSLAPASSSLGNAPQTGEKPDVPMKKKAKTSKNKNVGKESSVLSQTTGNKAGPRNTSESEEGSPTIKRNTEGNTITVVGTSATTASSAAAGTRTTAGPSTIANVARESGDVVMLDAETSQPSSSKARKSISADQVDYLQRKYAEEARMLNPAKDQEPATTTQSSKTTVTNDLETLRDAPALEIAQPSTQVTSSKPVESSVPKKPGKITAGPSGTKISESSVAVPISTAPITSSTTSKTTKKSKAPGKIVIPGPDPTLMQNHPVIEKPESAAVETSSSIHSLTNPKDATAALQENQKPSTTRNPKESWAMSKERLASLREFTRTDKLHSANSELLERANAPYSGILNEDILKTATVQKPAESSASLLEKAKKLRKLAENLRKAKADTVARDAEAKAAVAEREAAEALERERLEKASESQGALWDYIREELNEPGEREFFNLAAQIKAQSAAKKEEKKPKAKATAARKTAATAAGPSRTVPPSEPTFASFADPNLPSHNTEDWDALFNSYLGLAPGESIPTPEEARLAQEEIDREKREKEKAKKSEEKGKGKAVVVEAVDTSPSIDTWLGALEDPGNPEEVGLDELEARFEEMWGTGGGGPPTAPAFAVGGEVEGEGAADQQGVNSTDGSPTIRSSREPHGSQNDDGETTAPDHPTPLLLLPSGYTPHYPVARTTYGFRQYVDLQWSERG